MISVQQFRAKIIQQFISRARSSFQKRMVSISNLGSLISSSSAGDIYKHVAFFIDKKLLKTFFVALPPWAKRKASIGPRPKGGPRSSYVYRFGCSVNRCGGCGSCRGSVFMQSPAAPTICRERAILKLSAGSRLNYLILYHAGIQLFL